MSDTIIAKKEEKPVSFEESMEKNTIIAVVILIVLVLAGVPINLAVILAILITIYVNHLKNKK
jgi:hypothetical protein